MYRDASNYKAGGSQVVRGTIVTITNEELKAFKDIEDFIPYEVGFPALQEELMAYSKGKLTEDDHVWHSLEEWENTEEEATVDMTMDEFIRKFLNAPRNEIDEMVRLGL
jgi:hypothetical protein